MISTAPLTRMKKARLGKGLTQQDLGYLARVGAPDISKIETLRVRPYRVHAKRIARSHPVLGLKPKELQELVKEYTD